MTRREKIVEIRSEINSLNSRLYIALCLEDIVPDGESKDSVLKDVISEAEESLKKLNQSFTKLNQNGKD